MIKFILPFPPSVNIKYGINKNGKRYKSEKVKAWERAAREALNSQNILPIHGRVIIRYTLDTPDNMERDCGNYEKFTTDFLVSQGILKGDSRRYVKRISSGWNDTPGKAIHVLIRHCL